MDSATDLIDGCGVIVAEFFDVGWSRKVPWLLRPEASRLLAMVAEPGRRFDAVVIGEYERAFEGSQLQALLPAFRRHGVELWLPEFGGAVDEADPIHQAVLLLLGCQSRREVLRASSGPRRRCGPRPGIRVGILVVGRRMATGWWMAVRIRTGRMRGGVGGCTGWIRTR